MKTTLPFHPRRQPASAGFSLVEIVIALSIVAFAFLSIVGLMGVGLVSDQNSTQQTEATNIAAAIVADLRSTQNVPGAATYIPPHYGSTSPNGAIVLSATAPASTVTETTGAIFKNATSQILYFDDKGELTSKTSTAAPPIFYARVYSAQILKPSSTSNTNGNPLFAARVVVLWPYAAIAKSATNPPSGYVELNTEFQLHSN